MKYLYGTSQIKVSVSTLVERNYGIKALSPSPTVEAGY